MITRYIVKRLRLMDNISTCIYYVMSQYNHMYLSITYTAAGHARGLFDTAVFNEMAYPTQ
jgi:hypothetical protein